MKLGVSVAIAILLEVEFLGIVVGPVYCGSGSQCVGWSDSASTRHGRCRGRVIFVLGWLFLQWLGRWQGREFGFGKLSGQAGHGGLGEAVLRPKAGFSLVLVRRELIGQLTASEGRTLCSFPLS